MTRRSVETDQKCFHRHQNKQAAAGGGWRRFRSFTGFMKWHTDKKANKHTPNTEELLNLRCLRASSTLKQLHLFIDLQPFTLLQSPTHCKSYAHVGLFLFYDVATCILLSRSKQSLISPPTARPQGPDLWTGASDKSEVPWLRSPPATLQLLGSLHAMAFWPCKTQTVWKI